MKIVIELDEILYGEFLTYGIVGLNVDNQIEISKAIRKGTLLPEHHGRLIDADALDLEKEVNMADDWKTAHEIANCVKYAPTIIEGSESE